MKVLFLTIVGSLLSITLSANVYDTMWKTVEEKIKRDLPKSAKTELLKILERSKDDKNKEQALKAELYLVQVQHQISDDSLTVALQRLEQSEKTQKAALWKALWQGALAKTYMQVYESGYDTTALSKAKYYGRQALSNMSVLNRYKYTKLKALFSKSVDSRYYKDDLLHIFLDELLQKPFSSPFTVNEKIAWWNKALKLYTDKGCDDACLLIKLNLISCREEANQISSKEGAKEVLQLQKEYAKAKANIETYIALTYYWNRQALKGMKLADYYALLKDGIARYRSNRRVGELDMALSQITDKQVQIVAEKAYLSPGDKLKLTATCRNTQAAKVNICRVPMDMTQWKVLNQNQQARIVQSLAPEQTIMFHFPIAAPYEKMKQSQWVTFDKAGIYVVKFDDNPRAEEFIYVSDVYPLVVNMGNGTHWLRVIGRKNGHLLSDGKWMAIREEEVGHYVATPLTDLKEGVGNSLSNKDENYTQYLPYTATDKYALPVYIYSDWREDTTHVQHTYATLYTDRGIYRPGQKLSVGAVVYTQLNDEEQVLKEKFIDLLLKDSRGKVIESVALKTDRFGVVSKVFTLPLSVLPGEFFVAAKMGDKVLTQKSIRVDEYKRPTFEVVLHQPTGNYSLGDTIQVTGAVKTFSGLPLGNTEVAYRFVPVGEDDDEIVQTDTVKTDENGIFKLSVVVGSPLMARDFESQMIWFDLNVDVLASNGETQSNRMMIQAGLRQSFVDFTLPRVLCKEELPVVTFRWYNSSQQPLQGEGTLSVYQGETLWKTLAFTANKPFDMSFLKDAPSGQYKIKAAIGKNIDETAHFLLFSAADKALTITESLVGYRRYSPQKDSVYVMLGTKEKDVQVFYDIYAESGYTEHGSFLWNDTLLHRQWHYRPVFGDGAKQIWSFVKDGTLYSYEVSVQRPLPNKELTVKWATFRSRLQPGQEETWRLIVKNPHGKPAKASLMATLYDASLDQFVTNDWNYMSPISRKNPHLSVERYDDRGWDFYFNSDRRWRKHEELLLAQWRAKLFNYHDNVFEGQIYAFSAVNRKRESLFAERSISNGPELLDEPMKISHDNSSMESKKSVAMNKALRSNFAETAFFYPALMSNANGEVEISFTLPQSTTQWNFRGFVHNQAMNYATLEKTVIAQKSFMVQPNVPRFVRLQDKLSIPVMVLNNENAAQRGTLTCEVSNALTGEVLCTKKINFSLDANAQKGYQFTLPTFDKPEYLQVVVMGDTKQFSDGESHVVPVLSNREWITHSVPFSMTKAGVETLALDTLWQGKTFENARLIVEMTSNPTWYAVAALPPLVNKTCYSATDWAMQAYALTLSQTIAHQHPEWSSVDITAKDSVWTHVLQRNPELKQTLLSETPWENEGLTEGQRAEQLKMLFDAAHIAQLQKTAFDKIATYQQPDGGFSWFRGMHSNLFISLEVATLLARQEKMSVVPLHNETLSKVWSYIQKRMAEDIAERKERERERHYTTSLGELDYRYLYLCTIMNAPMNDEVGYLVDKLLKADMDLTIFGKARTALILKHYGRLDVAKKYIQSLKEYLVAQPQLGMYYDGYTAQRLPDSYQISSQCAAIEAFHAFGREYAHEIDQMQLWLMQAKRTQLWTSPTTTAEALYALLIEEPKGKSVMSWNEREALSYVLIKKVGKSTLSVQGATKAALLPGYIYDTYTQQPRDFEAIKIKKQKAGLSWGTVMAQYLLPTSEMKAAGKELSVERIWEVKRGEQWLPLSSAQQIKVGDKVRQVITFKALRDFDFVSLKSDRPANVEPTEPLSGYGYFGHLMAYRVVRDTNNEYFFEHLPKGKYVLTEEGFVNREGAYSAGVVRIQSIYAPEFVGNNNGGQMLKVE